MVAPLTGPREVWLMTKQNSSVLLAAFLVACFQPTLLFGQITPSCKPLEGQVTVGLQGYQFEDDANFLRQYRSFPDGDFRGNLTDVDVYICPDAEKDQTIEFHRRNPHRLVEFNSLLVNLEDFAFRVQLWRYRHRPLEVFPTPSGVGTAFGSVFNNDVPPATFFRTNRTRLDVEGRIKGSAFGEKSHVQNILVRFRNEQRSGVDQFRFVLGGGDRVSGFDTVRWRQEALDLSADVNELLAGVILGRPRNYALALLWFTDRYSNEAPLTTNATIAPFGGVTPTGATRIRTDGGLGLRTFDFIPDSRVLRPTVQFLKGWGEDKHLLFAAYTFSRLDQQRLTPLEELSASGYVGRTDSHVLTFSPIIQLTEGADLRPFFRNEIRTNNSSFGPGQFLDPAATFAAPRLDRLMRLRYGMELTYRPKKWRTSLTLEVSQRHTDRDLTFGESPSDFIPPEVSLLRPDTDITTLRFLGRVRPNKNSTLRAEYRFQSAQNTGLPSEPEVAHRFDVEAGYDFLRGGVNGGLAFHFQENRESNATHIFTGLIGSAPQASFTQDFVNNSRALDATLWFTPDTTPLTFTVSYNRFEDDSQQNFFTTNRRRFEIASGVLFTLQERTPYENITNTGSIGVNYQIGQRWAVHANYVINESTGSFSGSGLLSSTLQPFSAVDNRLQTVLAGATYSAPRGFDLRFQYSHDNYDNRIESGLSGSLHTFDFGVRKKF
jgi:hypothetical protein